MQKRLKREVYVKIMSDFKMIVCSISALTALAFIDNFAIKPLYADVASDGDLISANIISEYAGTGTYERFYGAFNSGVVRYYLEVDPQINKQLADFDFQTSFYVWTLSLGQNIELFRTNDPGDADIIFRIAHSPKYVQKYPRGTNAVFYSTAYSVPEDAEKGRPVIEMKPNPDSSNYLFIDEAIQTAISIPVVIYGKEKTKNTAELFGDANSPMDTALFITENCDWLLWNGNEVSVAGQPAYLRVSDIIHELGHAMGLADVYARTTQPQYKTVMETNIWMPLVPSSTDIMRVKKIQNKFLLQHHSCSSLFLLQN